MFFLRDYALPVTLTFDVRMNNALRAAMITWFQQLPAIVVTLFPRDPLSRFYIYLCFKHTAEAFTTNNCSATLCRKILSELQCQQSIYIVNVYGTEARAGGITAGRFTRAWGHSATER